MRERFQLIELIVFARLWSKKQMKEIKFNIQDQYLNIVRKERMPVKVTTAYGRKIEGYIKSFDTFCLLVENETEHILLYKHIIASISLPREALTSFRSQQTLTRSSATIRNQSPKVILRK